MKDPVREAEEALKRLEGLALRQEPPSHYSARHLLLALADLRREAPPAVAEQATVRARDVGARLGTKWAEAVQAELSMACGEFTQSVDPRYLGLPNYDLEYTRRARRLLEDRIQVARTLGFELPSREADMVMLADQVLETFARSRGAP